MTTGVSSMHPGLSPATLLTVERLLLSLALLVSTSCDHSKPPAKERTEQISALSEFEVVPPDASEADHAVAAVPRTQDPRVKKTEGEWSKLLPELVFRVTRLGETEPRFTGEMYRSAEPGRYQCACCETVIFSSNDKYASETGWPTFSQPVTADVIWTKEEAGAFRRRVAVACSACDAHLGHVFNDGPLPQGTRYSINASALKFLPNEAESAQAIQAIQSAKD
ncbi:MAG: peptide-methionine (R)-S-oxide reductase MsrB [Verrucomicrobia bacterium]|nr:peptide-methionine (R)-S-oxide reductase MsrB [Verrucomicrobiota bacterium]